MAENREKMAAIGRKLASLGSGGSALEGLQKDLSSTVGHSMLEVCLLGHSMYRLDAEPRELREIVTSKLGI